METEKKSPPGQEKEGEEIQPDKNLETGAEIKEAAEDLSKKEGQMITEFLEREVVNAGEITEEAEKPEEKKSGIRNFLEKHPKIIALIMAITVSTSLMAGNVEAGSRGRGRGSERESGWTIFLRESGKHFNTAANKNSREAYRSDQAIAKIYYQIRDLQFEEDQLMKKKDELAYNKLKLDLLNMSEKEKDRQRKGFENEDKRINSRIERIDRDIFHKEGLIQQEKIKEEARMQNNNANLYDHAGKVFIEKVLFPIPKK